MAHSTTSTSAALHMLADIKYATKDVVDFMYGDEKRTKRTLLFAYLCIAASTALEIYNQFSNNSCLSGL